MKKFITQVKVFTCSGNDIYSSALENEVNAFCAKVTVFDVKLAVSKSQYTVLVMYSEEVGV